MLQTYHYYCLCFHTYHCHATSYLPHVQKTYTLIHYAIVGGALYQLRHILYTLHTRVMPMQCRLPLPRQGRCSRQAKRQASSILLPRREARAGSLPMSVPPESEKRVERVLSWAECTSTLQRGEAECKRGQEHLFWEQEEEEVCKSGRYERWNDMRQRYRLGVADRR